MLTPEDCNEYQDERVSTEPQRKALDAMSEDLVRKLHAMVAEQEARARDFAAHQHSLSSLPQLQQTFQQAAIPPVSQLPPQSPPASTITNGPRLPKNRPQRNKAQQPYSPAPEWDSEVTPPTTPTQPQKESGIGAGTIITCIIIFLIIMRSCS